MNTLSNHRRERRSWLRLLLMYGQAMMIDANTEGGETSLRVTGRAAQATMSTIASPRTHPNSSLSFKASGSRFLRR